MIVSKDSMASLIPGKGMPSDAALRAPNVNLNTLRAVLVLGAGEAGSPSLFVSPVRAIGRWLADFGFLWPKGRQLKNPMVAVG
jgi:hypothetical protein